MRKADCTLPTAKTTEFKYSSLTGSFYQCLTAADRGVPTGLLSQILLEGSSSLTAVSSLPRCPIDQESSFLIFLEISSSGSGGTGTKTDSS